MRKRERDRMAKRLGKILDDLRTHVVGQLDGSIWYFENDAEIKGYSFAYATMRNAKQLSIDLEHLLNERKR